MLDQTTRSAKQVEKSRLGRLLVNRGYISEDQLNSALKIQVQEKKLLGEVLVEQGLISERELNRALKHQKRYRFAAAMVAMVAAPLQPMVALAASPVAAIPVPQSTQKLSANTMAASLPGGLKMLDDSDLAGVNAQGLPVGFGSNLAANLGINGAGSVAAMHNRFSDDDDDDTSEEEQIAYEIADSVLTMAGFGPISNLLDAEVKVEGFRRNSDNPAFEVLSEGRVRLNMGFDIDRVSMENVRVKGDESGRTFGSFYISDISYHPDSNIVIGPKR